MSAIHTWTASFFHLIHPAMQGLWRFFIRFLFLPTFKIIVLFRLRMTKLLLSARGFFFLLFTNRYVFQTVLLVISLSIIVSQFGVKNATALDVGQHSILYAMVTEDRAAVIEETPKPEGTKKDTHYLGAETIQAVPAVDYDFDEINQPLPADLALPGTIALLPDGSFVQPDEPVAPDEQPGVPSEPTPTQRTEITHYAIRSGDTISEIARRFGVDVPTILWANDLTSKTTLRLGQELRIPPVSGVLHTVKRGETAGKIASSYGVETIDLLRANFLSSGSRLPVGRELIVPGGQPRDESARTTAPRAIATSVPSAAKSATRTTGEVSAIRPDIPLSRIKNKAIDVYQELTKTNDSREKPQDAAEEKKTTRLLWPTRLHALTQYYGWRHTGIDVDGDYTDPIYASEDGLVEKAGWNNGGYGLQILIDHGNGIKTRYAHLSKIFVKEGDYVKRGQTISMVGTTGRSTGTHLHYEVIVNGKRKNPLAYIR